MIFDFQSFIEDLRVNPEKKEIVEQYEEFYGPIQGDISDQVWYTDYLCKFDFFDYKKPLEFVEDFDWDLLEKLVAASFNSDTTIETGEDGKPELQISVTHDEGVIVKRVSELWGFQIFRLFEIYIEEQLSIQIKRAEEEKRRAELKNSPFGGEEEENYVDVHRNNKIQSWNMARQRDVVKAEMEGKKEERKKRLEDLMGNL